MEKLSFIEKLGILGTNILAHPIFILLLLSPIIILALNKKIRKKIIILIYVIIIAIVLFVGNTTLFSLLDNLIDGIFMVIYFPNFITLFIVVVASAIIALVTFMKKSMLRVNKVINIVGFVIVQTIFCLVLTSIQVNGIDIYEENALYSNSDVLTLMQLLTGTFALQIIAVLVFNAIEKITEMLDNKDDKNRTYRNIERAKLLARDIDDDLFSVEEEENYDIVLEPQAPLDRSLITEEKMVPINLNEAISEENKKSIPTFTPEKIETFDLNSKPTTEPVKPVTPPIVPQEPLKVEPKEPIKHEPKVFVNKPVIPEVKEEPKELIKDLVIMNLDTTIRAITNIQRIYTM